MRSIPSSVKTRVVATSGLSVGLVVGAGLLVADEVMTIGSGDHDSRLHFRWS